MSEISLLVLAAGMGSRYGSLKQIEGVGPNDETILDYAVYDAIRAGFTQVVFVIRREIADEFKSTISGNFEDKIKVAYVYQDMNDLPEGVVPPEGRTKPWGTGHAVLSARNVIDGPFSVINADDFYGKDSFRLAADFFGMPPGTRQVNDPKSEYALIAFPLNRTLSEFGTVSRGICTCDDDGYLASIQEMTHISRRSDKLITNNPPEGCERVLDECQPVSMNMWSLRKDAMSKLETRFVQFIAGRSDSPKAEFYLPDSISDMIDEREVHCRVLTTESHWSGVTYKKDRDSLRKFILLQIEKGDYPKVLWGK